MCLLLFKKINIERFFPKSGSYSENIVWSEINKIDTKHNRSYLTLLMRIYIFSIIIPAHDVYADTNLFDNGLENNNYLNLLDNGFENNNYLNNANYLPIEKPVSNATNTPCNQSMSNVVAGGNVIQNCITTIQQQSEEEREKTKEIERSLRSISMDVTQIDNKSNISRQEIENNRNQLRNLKIKYNANKARITQLNGALHELKLRTRQDFASIKVRISDIEDYNLETEREIDSIGVRIDQQGMIISILEDRVEFLEDDVGFLMDEYNNGNLQSISFYGGDIEVAKIKDQTYSAVGLEYERLLDPRYQLSIFGGVSKNDGVVKTEYETLSGINPQVEENNVKFYTANIGARKFIKKIDDYQAYATIAAGKSFGDIDSVSAKAGAGVELYKKYHKLSAELGYKYYFSLPNKEVDFNPIGTSTIDNSNKGAGGPYLSIKYSTR